MITSLTSEDNPSIWKYLKNVPLLVAVFSMMDVSALFLAIVAVCGVLSIVLWRVPPSVEIEETTVQFASREI